MDKNKEIRNRGHVFISERVFNFVCVQTRAEDFQIFLSATPNFFTFSCGTKKIYVEEVINLITERET